jgi:hypothetical protein
MKIVRNSDDLSKYVEIAAGAKFPKFAPSVNTAERRFLLPVLGPAMFGKLAEALAGAAVLSDSMQALADLAQEAVANIALAISAVRLSVTVSENGLNRIESGTNKTAYQYQIIELRESYTRAGFDALDELLALMESAGDDYPDWKSSTAYTDFKRFFIRSGMEFSQGFDIRNSRYTYLAIRPTMRKVEDFEILPALGKKLFGVIKEQLQAGDLEPAYERLLDDYIRPAIANLTIARAVLEKSVDVSDFGVSVNVIQDNSNSQQRQPAPLDKIKAVAQQLTEDGNKYLSMLAEELGAHPEDYPDYEQPGAEASLFNIPNKQENSFLAV